MSNTPPPLWPTRKAHPKINESIDRIILLETSGGPMGEGISDGISPEWSRMNFAGYLKRQVLAAFNRLDWTPGTFSLDGPFRGSMDHQDGTSLYVEHWLSPVGEMDEFCITIEGGRMRWDDFTHTTDLGPLDGSEIEERMAAFDAEMAKASR